MLRSTKFLKKMYLFRFEDIADISMGKAGGSVQLTIMTGETIPFHSNRSRQIHSMISSYWKDAAPLGRLPRQTVKYCVFYHLNDSYYNYYC